MFKCKYETLCFKTLELSSLSGKNLVPEGFMNLQSQTLLDSLKKMDFHEFSKVFPSGMSNIVPRCSGMRGFWIDVFIQKHRSFHILLFIKRFWQAKGLGSLKVFIYGFISQVLFQSFNPEDNGEGVSVPFPVTFSSKVLLPE